MPGIITHSSETPLDQPHLSVGLYLDEIISPLPKTLAGETYGYDIYSISNPLRADESSVLLAIQPGGSSQPMEVIGDVIFRLRPILGRGVLLRTPPPRLQGRHPSVDVAYMDAARWPAGQVEEVGPEESSVLINIGNEPFVVRDDAYPDFQSDYEVPSRDEVLLGRAVSYQVAAAVRQLELLRYTE